MFRAIPNIRVLCISFMDVVGVGLSIIYNTNPILNYIKQCIIYFQSIRIYTLKSMSGDSLVESGLSENKCTIQNICVRVTQNV